MTLREKLAWKMLCRHALNVKVTESDQPGMVVINCQFEPFWHGLIEILGNCTLENLIDRYEESHPTKD